MKYNIAALLAGEHGKGNCSSSSAVIAATLKVAHRCSAVRFSQKVSPCFSCLNMEMSYMQRPVWCPVNTDVIVLFFSLLTALNMCHCVKSFPIHALMCTDTRGETSIHQTVEAEVTSSFLYELFPELSLLLQIKPASFNVFCMHVCVCGCTTVQRCGVCAISPLVCLLMQ